MRTFTFLFMSPLRLSLLVSVFLATVSQTYAQIYTVSIGSDTLGSYTTAGATLNASLVTGLSDPSGIVIANGTLYVTNQTGNSASGHTTSGDPVFPFFSLSNSYGIAAQGDVLYIVSNSGGSVTAFDRIAGATIAPAPRVSGLNSPRGVALSGNRLYVAQTGSNSVGVYDATTGVAINAALVSGLNAPRGVAVDGNRLYISNFAGDNIGVYDATTGATIQANLVTSLAQPLGIKITGGKLYVANVNSGTIGVYSAATGSLINAALISGLNQPYDIAVVPDPIVVVNGKKRIVTTRSPITLKGTANESATSVEVQAGRGAFRPALGVASWSFKARLKPGKTRLLVRATGGPGSIPSPIVSVTAIRQTR